ncbi:MAG TPA: class I SAM-dependent methyltransferase, partial [Candidatus Angelobacter sp.]|nr:class I SAM-dependent methyltransferase [Candidatus Angelobacter sp.]
LTLAGSLYYTSDYLHLTVVPDKKQRWQVKVRWRIVAAVLVLGLLLSSTNQTRFLVVAAAAWLAICNYCIKRFAQLRQYSAWFWATDLVLFGSLFLTGELSLILGSLLLAAAAHLAIVTGEPQLASLRRVCLLGLVVIVFSWRMHRNDLKLLLACAALLVVSAAISFVLMKQAEKQNDQNIAAAMHELLDFTGYTSKRIRELWETSNQQLAKNWEQAAIPHDDRERMAEWYRQNSELYLFAISAYNLEYKRIKSNLKVIRFARGSCLDYGAGNAEILLELARRGHPVTYFDVEGVTMRFARTRAQQHGLTMNFARTKDDLRAATQQRGFDTIFSFDVLEHLPDLPGELTFLSSLLAPNGVFVFDVPAGSTKAHPMHLNHNLNVLDFLSAKGLKDRRSFSLRMPFRKEEKYVFEA